MASATLVIGLISANQRTPVGMVSTATRAELAKVRGTTQTKPASWTDSAWRTVTPM